MLIIDDGDNGGDQGGRSCGSAVAILLQIQVLSEIYTLYRRFSGSFQKAQQCCCRTKGSMHF